MASVKTYIDNSSVTVSAEKLAILLLVQLNQSILDDL